MTVLAFPEPEPRPQGVDSWKYEFTVQDDAHAFLAGVKEDLADEAGADYVDSEIWFSEEVQKWILRVDAVRLDVGFPNTHLAA